MIVYNVERRWFTMKNDAEAHRKGLGLPPSATFTLRIDSREELAGLLNGLCGIEPAEVEVPASVEGVTLTVAPIGVVSRNQIAAPDFVPRFLVEAWEKRDKRVPE